MKRLFLFLLSMIVVIGCDRIVVSPQTPDVVNEEIIVSSTSATIVFYIEHQDGFCPQVEISIDSLFASSQRFESMMMDGNFVAHLDGLNMNTKYYYRYIVASNSSGAMMIINDGKWFVTSNSMVIVETLEVSNVTWNGSSCSAMAGGKVLELGEAEATERGVCWSKVTNPTIEDSHATDDSGNSIIVVRMTNLEPSSVYHVRAYAISDSEIIYGEDVAFATINKWQDGILPGVFSVSETKKIHFSQGNLQFIGSDAIPHWKFAEHQWETLGKDGPDEESPAIDRDLFGWGTSNYAHGAVCYQPWSMAPQSYTSPSHTDYYAYGDPAYNLYDQTGRADWGYNAISNGGDREGYGWRTLTVEEWRYVILSRPTLSDIRFVWATVNEKQGMLLIPDDWVNDYPTLNAQSSISPHYDNNIIDERQWEAFEREGLVFLPLTGRRWYTHIQNAGFGGYYWSSSQKNVAYAYSMSFSGVSSGIVDEYRDHGLSVRVVLDAVSK